MPPPLHLPVQSQSHSLAGASAVSWSDPQLKFNVELPAIEIQVDSSLPKARQSIFAEQIVPMPLVQLRLSCPILAVDNRPIKAACNRFLMRLSMDAIQIMNCTHDSELLSLGSAGHRSTSNAAEAGDLEVRNLQSSLCHPLERDRIPDCLLLMSQITAVDLAGSTILADQEGCAQPGVSSRDQLTKIRCCVLAWRTPSVTVVQHATITSLPALRLRIDVRTAREVYVTLTSIRSELRRLLRTDAKQPQSSADGRRGVVILGASAPLMNAQLHLTTQGNDSFINVQIPVFRFSRCASFSFVNSMHAEAYDSSDEMVGMALDEALLASRSGESFSRIARRMLGWHYGYYLASSIMRTMMMQMIRSHSICLLAMTMVLVSLSLLRAFDIEQVILL